ncbi:LOW QUALITY PROTEIN: uncharacterized protein FYW61_021844 [Anableps anableps]
MACTSQSAKDYIQNARPHLVGELRNLSVILENLYQQGVLIDEEVSKIKAEKDDYDRTRAMLDSVIRKGEAACYKLLRIIYMTRRRTLNRPSHDASTKAKKFDLHHWTSCFPFKEDEEIDVNFIKGPRPCHRYHAKLKSVAKTLSKDFWRGSKNLFEENRKSELSFYSPVLDIEGTTSPSKVKTFKNKKSKLSRPKKLRTYIPENKPEISPTDLLKTDKNILLIGKPGIGKTALSHEILRLWAERDNKELDYMFYFDMRELTNIPTSMSLEDLLFNVYSEPDMGKDEILQDMKRHSDNVTVILDGVTDLSSSIVKKLLKKTVLPFAKIIITCRPDDEEDLCLEDWLRVEVKGFSEEMIRTYLSASLGEDHRKVLSNVELLTLSHVPMYALMVAASFSSEDSLQPRTVTEIYINIVRFCLQLNSNKIRIKNLNQFIKTKENEILSLAEAAFNATERRTVNLEELSCEDSCVLSFLKPLDVKVAPTETITVYAFLHYTMQEFFAALWLLKNPDKIREVFQQCLTEEMKHMKHLIPFMCRLLNEKNPSLMCCLTPVKELNATSEWFFKEMINTFFRRTVANSSKPHVDTVLLYQCLFESQNSEACISFLNKLNYHLDLSGENLDPYSCCAVAYVVTQSKERKINLNLQDVTISAQGMRQLFGCLQNVQWCDPLPQQLWKILLLGEGQIDDLNVQMDYETLLRLDGNQLHLPVRGEKQLFERAVRVMQSAATKVEVCLYRYRWAPGFRSLHEYLVEVLSNISSISYKHQSDFLLDLFSQMKDRETKTGLSLLPSLQSVFQSAPPVWTIDLSKRKTSILLEVMKLQSEKKPVKLTGCSHEESEVRSFLQCLPYISQLSFDLQSSDRHEQTRFLVNLFCAAAERKQKTGEKMLKMLASVCRYEGFPLEEGYMVDEYYFDYDEDDIAEDQSDFLLDLYSQMKDRETKTGLSLLPSLESVFQSTPPVWTIKLSEGKTSILLEVMKLQSEKKPVKLTDCSHEESEVRSFLQCLPYISELRFYLWSTDLKDQTRFLVNLFCAAAEREQQTGEKMLEMLASVLSDGGLPDIKRDFLDEYYDYNKDQSDFLLDLFSQMKDRETKTGLSLLPSLQSVFQSAPPVWTIDLSEGKTSIFLEVMKLQSEKKPVKLTDCSHEESEVRSFLQFLPYISQLSICSWSSDQTRFLVNLFCAAAEREQQTGEKMLEMLASVCRYEGFPINKKDIDHNYYDEDFCEEEYVDDYAEDQSDFLLDLFSQMKDRETKTAAEREQQTGEKMLEMLASVCRYKGFPIVEDSMKDDDFKYHVDFLLDLFSQMKDRETKTGLSLLPSLQSVFQSAPPVWTIDLSKRKTSILLEVMKLQSEKKPVKLTGCSHEESEVRSFLQCLPYISQLSCDPGFFQSVCSSLSVRSREEVQQLVSQLQLLNFKLLLTGELRRKACSSVGRVLPLCGSKVDLILTDSQMSIRRAAVLFRSTTQLHSLRLSSSVALFLSQWVRRGRVASPLVLEELSVVSTKYQPQRLLVKVGSCLASLLRFWTVRRLDLTESGLPAQSLFSLLLHDAPLTVR